MTMEGKTRSEASLDIDSSEFDSEAYLGALLRTSSLKRAMEREAEIVRESRVLHSEMQTLVYENYNKFISATDTVRKMRKDFETMQTEMARLDENAARIATFAKTISSSLEEGRERVSRLCDTSRLLERLQFLFLLPKRLETAVEEGRLSDAVDDFVRARPALERSGSSFDAIRGDCERIVAAIVDRLEAGLAADPESVRLLHRLRSCGSAPDPDLHRVFLERSGPRLREHLALLGSPKADRLEWVEAANAGLLGDLGRVAASYEETFAGVDDDLLLDFGDAIVGDYLKAARERLSVEATYDDGTLVRALDRFYGRLQATAGHRLVEDALEVVMSIIKDAGQALSDETSRCFKERLVATRRDATGKPSEEAEDALAGLTLCIEESSLASIKRLSPFLTEAPSFGLKPQCERAVARARDSLLTQVVEQVCITARSLDEGAPPRLLLILSRLCLDLESEVISRLFAAADSVVERPASEPDPAPSLKASSGEAGRFLLDAYAARVGSNVSQMLRVSVLSREWVRAPEPRGVRAVARRVLEALAAAERDCARLFGGSRGVEAPNSTTRQSSDSSRRARSMRLSDVASSASVAKLFSDRIEIFAPVEPTKASIMTAIVKIGLKTFLECVRLRTYSRHGLQQMQVDVRYLQLYLWQYVHDENLVHVMLDEVLASAINRCIDPRLMEPSVVEIICERG